MEHPIVINSHGELINKQSWQGILKNYSLNGFKAKLAAAMAAPIRRNLDYQGIARRALLVQPLDEKK